MKKQLVLEGKLMKGRRILFEVYKNCRISEMDGSILDLQDIMLCGDSDQMWNL